jgi:hypothetical protein
LQGTRRTLSLCYAVLVKLYGTTNGKGGGSGKYSPAVCIGSRADVIAGEPDPTRISTSHVERLNPTTRMSVRRFTRLTNAFSKRVENHTAAVALHFAYYNYCRARYGRGISN